MSNDIPLRTRAQLQGLSKLIKNTFIHCVPGATFREIIKLTSDPTAPMESIVETILANPLYSHFFISIDILSSKIALWEEEERNNSQKERILLDRSIQLLNRKVTRNIVAAIQLNRLRNAGLPRSKSDKLTLSPREQLRFATMAEDDCLEWELPGSDFAFLAGYHFDLLSAVYTTRKVSKEIIAAVESSWNEGLRAAQIAAQIASRLNSFHFHSYIFGATLIAPIGKVLMTELYPKEHLHHQANPVWSSFVSQCAKFENKSQLALWVGEFHRFGLSYAELSGFYASFLGIFTPVASALSHHMDPQNLLPEQPDLYQLAGLISISLTLSSLKASQNREAYLTSIQLQCLEKLGIQPQDIDPICNPLFQ